MLLVEIEARLAGLDLAADRGRHAAPRALDAGEIFRDRADGTVLLDQLVHHLVERLEHALVHLNVPVAMRHDIVAVPAALRRRGELVLLALRRDVIDLDLDLVPSRPSVAQLVSVLLARAPNGPSSEAQRRPHDGR